MCCWDFGCVIFVLRGGLPILIKGERGCCCDLLCCVCGSYACCSCVECVVWLGEEMDQLWVLKLFFLGTAVHLNWA